MDINTLKHQIINSGFTNDQLNELSLAINYSRVQLSRQIKRALAVGDTVEFTHTRSGTQHRGTVQKINIKYVVVYCHNNLITYRVPAAMLTKV